MVVVDAGGREPAGVGVVAELLAVAPCRLLQLHMLTVDLAGVHNGKEGFKLALLTSRAAQILGGSTSKNCSPPPSPKKVTT